MVGCHPFWRIQTKCIYKDVVHYRSSTGAGMGGFPVGSPGQLSADSHAQTPPWTYWVWISGAGSGTQDLDRLFRVFCGLVQAPLDQALRRHISRELVHYPSRQLIASLALIWCLPQNMLNPSSMWVPHILKSTIRVLLQS